MLMCSTFSSDKLNENWKWSKKVVQMAPNVKDEYIFVYYKLTALTVSTERLLRNEV